MLTILAILPIAVLLFDLLVFKRHIFTSIAIMAGVTLVIALGVWRIDIALIPYSLLKGAFVAADIIIIVLGALFFLNVLKKIGVIGGIEYYLTKISSDARVQLIILAWLFGSLIEGSAGFGTPAMIVAPLLVHLGFGAVFAITAALTANSVAVIFGAVGTPIRIGFLDFAELSGEVGAAAANAGMILALFVPLILLAMATIKFKKGLDYFKDGIPFALWCGVAMAVPFRAAVALGIEFPSLIGPTVGLLLVYFTSRRKFFLPQQTHSIRTVAQDRAPASKKEIVAPYAILLGLLIMGRFILPSFDITLFGSINHSFNLANPGIALAVVAAALALKHRVRASSLGQAAKGLSPLFVKTALVIFGVVSVMQIMIHSHLNRSGLESMIFHAFAGASQAFLPIFSPLVGALGAFVGGSATLSNLIFGHAQYTAAGFAGYPIALILALQLVGATAGNMISLTNIVAAQAALGTHGHEGRLIKRILPASLIYLGLTMAVGTIFYVLMR